MKSKRKNENSSKVSFTIAFCTFRDIVSLYLEKLLLLLFQNIAFFELGLDEILCRNLIQNSWSVQQNLTLDQCDASQIESKIVLSALKADWSFYPNRPYYFVNAPCILNGTGHTLKTPVDDFKTSFCSYARPAQHGPNRIRLCGPCIAAIAGD